MNGISGLGSQPSLLTNVERPQIGNQPDVGQAFQDFVAGTFFKQMLKALRSTVHEPAYMHGGKAEEMFQSQMDQQIAEDLARDHGADFAGPMYTTFATHLRHKLQQQGATSAPLPPAESNSAADTPVAKIGK